MPHQSFTGPDRRTYTRIFYQAGKQPILLFKTHRFDVTDISERGLGFINEAGMRLGKQIQATVVFSNGKSFSFEGRVVGKKGRKVSIYFKDLMPHELVLQQQQAVLKII